MALIDELRVKYKKACEDNQKKIDEYVENLYNSIINFVEQSVEKGKSYVLTSLYTPLYTPKNEKQIQDKVIEKLKSNGLTVVFNDLENSFEISGWANEPSFWEKAFME